MSPTSPRQPGAGGARQQASAAPFKVNRDSHLIHKASSSSSTNSSVSSSSGATNDGAGHRPKQHAQQPVIIYTDSPKVIRTNPRDFMSIVQKLTGLESTGAAAAARGGATANAGSVVAAQDESSSSSESCANAHPSAPPSYMDPQLMPPPPLDAHFMPDIPLFAPDAPELLCASWGLYGQFPPVDAAALGPVMSPRRWWRR